MQIAKYKIRRQNIKCLAFWLSGLLAFWFFSSVCWGGKYAADFLSIGVGAKALSLGSTGVANSDDVFSSYWNPAALVKVKNNSLGMMHTSMFSGIENYNFVGLVSNFENESAGISWIRLGIDDIPVYPELEGTPEERLDNKLLQPSGEPSGYIKNIENVFFLSYAHSIKEPLQLFLPVSVSFGGNFKYLIANSGNMSSKGLGFDLASLFSNKSTFLLSKKNSLIHRRMVGIVIQDLTTTTIKWSSDHSDVVPVNFKLGFAYNIERFSKYGFTLTLDFETRYGFSSHLGFEAEIRELIALRLGIDSSDITAGAGFKLKNFLLDYAFTSSELANSHFISLQLDF